MRILLDENFPRKLIQAFVGHECAHVGDIGWQGTLNGALLSKAEEAGFNVLLTFDVGIPKEHDISKRNIAVYVIRPEGQGPAAARALVGDILVALETCTPGEVLTLTNRVGKRPE
jgi:uncharacterized protein DUF5615